MAGKSGDILTKAATEYAAAKAGDVIHNLGDRASGNGPKKEKDPDNKGFVGTAAQKMGEGAGPVKSLMSGAGSAIKGLFTRSGGGGGKRPHNIVEDVYIGVPPDVCFAAFTQWEEFPSFMKGPTSVTRGDETPEEELEEGQHPLEGEETNWKGKVFLSTREQKSTTIDYDPPHRVSWKSEGSKGTIDGTVTFTPIGDNATLMLVVLEYRSKGPIEWIANRWRAVGRRMRLDLKHFRRYVMRTEQDDLPDPEEADEIPEDAKSEEESEEQDQSDEQSEDSSDEGSDEQEDETEESEEGESDDDSEESGEEESTDGGEGEAEEEAPKARPTRRARG